MILLREKKTLTKILNTIVSLFYQKRTLVTKIIKKVNSCYFAPSILFWYNTGVKFWPRRHYIKIIVSYKHSLSSHILYKAKIILVRQKFEIFSNSLSNSSFFIVQWAFLYRFSYSYRSSKLAILISLLYILYQFFILEYDFFSTLIPI